MRAEEIELSVPDGWSVTVLVNATPIRSANGAGRLTGGHAPGPVAAQGAGPSPGRVPGHGGHELRTLLSSIKGSATNALSTEPELNPAEMCEFFRIIDEQADHVRGLIGDLLDVGRIDSGTLSVSACCY